MTLSDAIEKMRKHRLLIGITDGEKSDRATALDMLLGIAKRELVKIIKIDTSIEPCHVKAADFETKEMYTYECYPCPNCGKWLHANTNYHYCPFCGIRIDWSDVK